MVPLLWSLCTVERLCVGTRTACHLRKQMHLFILVSSRVSVTSLGKYGDGNL